MEKLGITMVICMLCAGCASSQMTLRKLDQDIPSALVERYNSNTAPYVDEGEMWSLPLLTFSEAHVAKTDQGFQAYRGGSLGIGLLLAGEEHTDFDPKGRLLKYEAKGSLLTGLLLSERESHVRKGEDLIKGSAWSTLWGAFGFAQEPNGAKRLTLLWIPIPVSRGDKHSNSLDLTHAGPGRASKDAETCVRQGE